MRAFALALSVCLVLAAGVGSPEAKRAIHPKAGTYVGKVTNANGKGKVQLIFATFNSNGKDRKGASLFKWTGILKCKDGSSSEVDPSVFAPLKGARFSGRSKIGAQTVTLAGRFTANTKMRGTARVKSRGCDTGPVTFRAKLR
jgi:hypothetical protein